MKEQLDASAAGAIIIGGGTDLAHRLATRWLRSPWPVLRDADRSVYRAYGLERALLLLQESGTFVIDPKGVVTLAHSGPNPHTALPVDRILASLLSTPG